MCANTVLFTVSYLEIFVTAHTVIDAIKHAVESDYHFTAQELSDIKLNTIEVIPYTLIQGPQSIDKHNPTNNTHHFIFLISIYITLSLQSFVSLDTHTFHLISNINILPFHNLLIRKHF